MDLWQFYEEIEKLIAELRSAGYLVQAEHVDTAIHGGATSGEVLSRLSASLPEVARRVPQFRQKAESLAVWAKRAQEG